MSDVELSYLSATEAAALIRDGSLSPVALVTNALERIEEVNPKLNCFCFYLSVRGHRAGTKGGAGDRDRR